MKLLAILVIFLTGGFVIMEFSRLKMYGVLSDGEIDLAIDKVVENLSLGANKDNLRALLKETALAESNYGKTPDFTPDFGKGVFQLDKIGFDDAKLVSRSIKEQVLKMGYDIDKIEYTDKRVTQDILFNTIIARLLYYRKPRVIPSTREGRASYWKKYYNSILGAGSVEAYLARSDGYA